MVNFYDFYAIAPVWALIQIRFELAEQVAFKTPGFIADESPVPFRATSFSHHKCLLTSQSFETVTGHLPADL